MQIMTPLPKVSAADATATPSTPLALGAILEEFEQWRSTKAAPYDPIPEALWQKIFTLAHTMPLTKIRALFGITPAQYQKKFQELFPDESNPPSPSQPAPPTPDWCEVKPHKPFYQPAKFPAATTMIVEFCRPDGQVMKIHTTTDNFQTLIHLFFTGDPYASNQPPA